MSDPAVAAFGTRRIMGDDLRDILDPALSETREGIMEARRILKAERCSLNNMMLGLERGGTVVLRSHEQARLAAVKARLRLISETLSTLRERYDALDFQSADKARFQGAFVWFAKRMLDAETFDAIRAKAQEAEDNGGIRSSLGVGSAIGINAGVAPMKERP